MRTAAVLFALAMLATLSVPALGEVASPPASPAPVRSVAPRVSKATPRVGAPFTQAPLPYDFSALEPHIDTRTMEIHYGKHHATYVAKLNAALEGHPELQGLTVEELLKQIDRVPESIRRAVRNNGGGHANHALFWQVMSPKGGGSPTGKLAEAITRDFGSLEAMKKQFGEAALAQFGSGWAWLVVKDGKLKITSTTNQDTPLMEGATPILTLDVWEHAYYLKYQNRRAEYVTAWWNVVDWKRVAENFEKVR